MLFGDKKQVAIESEFHRPIEKYVFGQICLWADNKQIGNYEQTVLLDPIADYLRSTLNFQGRRHDHTLVNIPPQHALNIVYDALYGKDLVSHNLPDITGKWEQYSKFCICPNGCEAFDGEFAILIEELEKERFIWKDFFDKEVYEIWFNPGEYEKTVQAFLDWHAINPDEKEL